MYFIIQCPPRHDPNVISTPFPHLNTPTQVFPKEVLKLKNVRELQCAGNGLKELPEEISELPNIQVNFHTQIAIFKNHTSG